MADLFHYGTPRKSGRYPWGSGENGEQRNTSLRGHIKELKEQGLSESTIAKGIGMTVAEMRARVSIEKDEQKNADASMALRLKDKGYSNVEIGRRMGKNESSIRNLLNPAMNERANITKNTAIMLKKQIEEKKYLDVGAGVEAHIGVTRTRLNTAIELLKLEGYAVQTIQVDQLGTDKKTYIKVLSKDDVTYKDLVTNKDQIRTITDWTDNGGRSYLGLEPVKSVSSDRLQVRFAEEGGSDKDGVIELRRGLDDLSLGGSKYAQVRIAVDDTHYLKGMAIYSDNMPDGVDMIFNTNKKKGTPILGSKDSSVLKPLKDDDDNPFGATVRQKHYTDKDGKDQLSPINIVNEEGDWNKWSRSLSSQVLSKQPNELAKKQLELALAIKKDEYNEILSLNNPAVKKSLLDSFADDCDSASVHLKAAALPRQGNYVILPVPEMKETEIYAPKYNNGDVVVLIRHPHAGRFEIPQLTVNNKSKEAQAIMKNAEDAVGIHPKVAQKLSGADFDGDSVLVIPNNNKSIKVAPSLERLKDFDPNIAYPGYPGMPVITARNKQTEMGKISNLITDMTIKGATPDELASAARHSMVVIDAEKHKLNYRQSAIDNNISHLKTIYQGGPTKGASTLISKASSEIRVNQYKEAYKPDPLTGKKIYIPTGDSYINKKGQVVMKTTKTTPMASTDDAHTLSSGTRMEKIYADHANSLKALANAARKESYHTPLTKYSPSAKKVYKEEVESLNSQLKLVNYNKPLERQAQLLANKTLAAKRAANPDLEASEIKKIKGQALAEARLRINPDGRHQINLTPKEWEAIQAGAVSNSVLMQILRNTDIDVVKKYATPRTQTGLSSAKISRAKQLMLAGYTQAEIANKLGVSTSTLSNALKGVD